MADCVVGLVEPDEVVTHPAQILKCRVESIDRLNESTLALRLRPNRPLQFTAGQFATLDFGAGLVRPYSMANAEDVKLLEFHLRRRHGGPMLLVGGGTGLAPIRSIARTVLGSTAQQPLHIYVGARSEAELYDVEQLRALERSHLRSWIGERSVIVVRNHDNAIHVVENRCAHRGVQFCQQNFGRAREFVCPYHQWTYDLAGKLLGLPFRRGVKRDGAVQSGLPADFKPDDHGLTRLQVAIRGGVARSPNARLASVWKRTLRCPPLHQNLGAA